MTESRPPAAPRHADPGSPDHGGPNPLQRPLPPGMGRRSAGVSTTPAAAAPERPLQDFGRRAAPATSSAGAVRSTPERASRLAAPRQAAPRQAAPRQAAPRAANGAANGAAIPLMAPPPWQVKEMQAEEREHAAERTIAEQRGLPGWMALVVLLVITGIGGLIDALAGAGIKGAFSIGLIVGALAAILLVRRSAMFPIVVAPPLVYFIASAVLLYVRSGGLSNRAAITDAAASWLVYGFPAIAGATAVVLIVAGVRMILHR